MKNEVEFRVEWSETDPATITFYPNYFKWFDRGTWSLLAAAGLTYDVLRDEYGLIGCPIVEATSRFHSPTRFWEQVRLSSYVRTWRRKAFQVDHEVRVGDRLCAEGSEIRVWARPSAAIPGGIEAVVAPEEIKRRLPAFET